MFLGMIGNQCRKDFLELAIELCMADGNFADDEREMLRQYGVEVGVVGTESAEVMMNRYEKAITEKENNGEDSCKRDFRIHTLIERIKDNSDERERKIILFELLGLAYADDNFAEEEKKFIREAKEVFGIEDEFVEKAMLLLEQYMELQEKITGYVLG